MQGYATDSFWQQNRGETPRSGGMPHGPFDVCVIGAGIAGLSAAYHLMRGGARVLVLDDGPVGGGQTGRTTAHLSCVLDDRYAELEQLRGAGIARLAAESHAAAIDAIEATAAREGIACGLRRVDAYLLAAEPQHQRMLEAEEAAARRAGLSVESLARAPLPGFDSGPCLRFANQARFDPLAYLDGLARMLLDNGATILTDAHVEAIEDGAPVRVRTADDVLFEAGAAIVATNAPIHTRVRMPAVLFPHVSYVVGLELPPGSRPLADALYWDTADPYHYVRLAAHGEAQPQLLLVGGEDHPTGRDDAGAERRFARLEDWARSHFPGVGALRQRWSGQVLETLDGLALIGRSPGERNVYVATGDSGMGMTHGTIAGLLLCELVSGRSSAWTEVYDPARLPPRTLTTAASENLANSAEYGRWLRRGDVESADAIAPGTGAILRDGLRPRALYRDEGGRLHETSAACPHLGGLVCWNALEKTWDCPVHGSRFDCYGAPIQGPANTPLERPSGPSS